MTPYIEFFVPGIPATAGSKKAFYNKKAKRAMIVDASAKTKPWMAVVASFALDAMRKAGKAKMLGPVMLGAEFLLPRPKGHYRTGKRAGELKLDAPLWCMRQDLDKLVRAIQDAMTEIVWHDDSQVVRFDKVQKVYAGPTEPTGARVYVYAIEE